MWELRIGFVCLHCRCQRVGLILTFIFLYRISCGDTYVVLHVHMSTFRNKLNFDLYLFIYYNLVLYLGDVKFKLVIYTSHCFTFVSIVHFRYCILHSLLHLNHHNTISLSCSRHHLCKFFFFVVFFTMLVRVTK